MLLSNNSYLCMLHWCLDFVALQCFCVIVVSCWNQSCECVNKTLELWLIIYKAEIGSCKVMVANYIKHIFRKHYDSNIMFEYDIKNKRNDWQWEQSTAEKPLKMLNAYWHCSMAVLFIMQWSIWHFKG